MKVISKENSKAGRPIFNWATDLENGALEQAVNLSNLPFTVHHVSLMPDAHQGYGMPIGGVIGTDGVIIPNAVGVDIGCGMCALGTGIQANAIDREQWSVILGGSKEYQGGVRGRIPVGFKHRNKKVDYQFLPGNYGSLKIVDQEYESARHQLGTLGGGNHFIEFQKDNDGWLWVMIHSGSRNLGYKVAKHYNEIAKTLNKKWFTKVDLKWDLAFLPLDTDEGQDYIKEMSYCVEFSYANRNYMMDIIIEILDNIFSGFGQEPLINIAHNYATIEHHYNKNIMIHRKGATRAREGDIGIIPGSQGTNSYIVRGLGDQESFTSCSHGAGRKMGRKQAQRELNLKEEVKRLDDQGIIHSIRNEKDLDEAPGSYKYIDVVMENQKDLVEIVHRLTPLAVVKG